MGTRWHSREPKYRESRPTIYKCETIATRSQSVSDFLVIDYAVKAAILLTVKAHAHPIDEMFYDKLRVFCK